MTGAEARLGAPPVTALRSSRLGMGDRVAIATVVALLGAFIALPLASVAYEALRAGVPAALATFGDPDARSAIILTAGVAVITVAINGVLGVLAAWTLAKYTFPGKALVLSIIDLPLTVSPVVAGLAILLCFGSTSPLGTWFAAHGWKIAFAPPGIILATIFVTFPYVARETLALMNETGRDLEEAALGLGASVWQTFWRVTFPGARWAILNGLLLCNARALGEFGAVSVISGHIKGLTDTVPLHIEILYNDDNLVGAFTLAAALALAAIALTLIRSALDAHMHRRDDSWTL
jgi:sulfate/thiosulfate transport system permease protein